MNDTDLEDAYDRIQSEVSKLIVGNETVIKRMFIALLTRGHVILEGYPGTGKTTLANAFTQVTGLDYSRIQMTSDLLPADITGTEVYRENKGEFELQRGPIFSNLVVADEINRATPKTQSALLEALQEEQVTIGGETLPLPSPFMMVATQNPLEVQGVFDLPEAQRDRFQFKLSVGLLSDENEEALLDRFDADPDLVPEELQQVVSVDEIVSSRRQVKSVYVDDKIKKYLLLVAKATRDHEATVYGASPRAALTYMNACKARAAIHGRDYVIPDDVEELAKSVLAHRLVLSTDADLRGQTLSDVIDAVLSSVEVPRDEVADVPEFEQTADEAQ